MRRQPRTVKPVRIMDGEHLAAVVTSEAGQITIRPEPGWKITTATINVTMRRTNTRKEHRTSATIGASSLNEDSTP